MKKMIWVPTVCLSLLISACGTNNDGAQNYAANDYKTNGTNPYRNMNLYPNGGADVNRDGGFVNQRTNFLKSQTDLSNNQSLIQRSGYGGRDSYLRNSMNRSASYQGYGTSYDQGYGMNIGQTHSLYKTNGTNNQNMNDQRVNDNMQGKSEIGFSQVKSNQRTQQAGNQFNKVYVDRQLMASFIAHLVRGIPEVNRATVLVTDDHVFVNVGTKQNDQDKAKYSIAYIQEQVKKTALSVTPRYYQIKVSTDASTNQKLINIGQDNKNANQNTMQIERIMNGKGKPTLNLNGSMSR